VDRGDRPGGRPPGAPLRDDERGTADGITVNGAAGLDMSSRRFVEDPDLTARVLRASTTAEVALPRDGGPVEIRVDHAEALTAAGRPPGPTDAMTTTWEVTAPIAAVDTTVPADVATRETCPSG
jgi:hypothetical protein